MERAAGAKRAGQGKKKPQGSPFITRGHRRHPPHQSLQTAPRAEKREGFGKEKADGFLYTGSELGGCRNAARCSSNYLGNREAREITFSFF